MTLKLFNGDAAEPRKVGRVYTDTADYFWCDDGYWYSEQDPERTLFFNAARHGREIDSVMADAFTNVLSHVSSLVPGSKWELLIKHDNVPGRLY